MIVFCGFLLGPHQDGEGTTEPFLHSRVQRVPADVGDAEVGSPEHSKNGLSLSLVVKHLGGQYLAGRA